MFPTHVHRFLTMFRLFISSSMGFFFGMTRLVRPRCKAPRIFPSTCSTSSDVLRGKPHCNYAQNSPNSNGISLEIVRIVNILDVMNGLVEVIGRVLDLRQLPRRVLINGRPLDLVLLPLHLERDIGMRDRVPRQCDDTFQLVLRHRQHELVHLLAGAVVVMLRHREAARAFHQYQLQLL